MDNTRRFETGIEIIPKTPLTADSMGELEVNSVDGKLNYHNGTSESPIVTEDHTATLENKTIDGDDNTLQDISLSSLKTVLGDANKILKRDASGVVVSSDTTLDASNNLKVPGTIYGGSGSIDSSAILQVDSTTKGAIFPRMTTAQRNAIVSPANALWIFNTDTRIFEYYDSVSASWAAVGAGSGGVVLTAQESIGTGDGVTTSFGPLTNVPNSEEAVLVTVDGIVDDEANWSLSGSNIIFSVAPAAAQTIYVYYMYGAGPGGGGEANTASNMGTGADGEGLATAKVGVDLPFKRIKEGHGIDLTSETNDVLIDVDESELAINSISGTLGPTKGGTGQSTYTTGDTLYASAANTLSKLPIGSTGQVLTVASGIPSWAAASSTPPTRQVFATAGTFTGGWVKPANLKYVIVTVIGAGGGSGAANQAATCATGGGGAGSVRISAPILASSLGATEDVVVGTGGSGGSAAGPDPGTTGGTSSFGTVIIISALGGTGSAAISSGNISSTTGLGAGSGGVASANSILYRGGDGMYSAFVGGTYSAGGAGGANVFGASRQGSIRNGVGGGTAGTTGYSPGGGAGGASVFTSGSAAGGTGGAGMVIVDEYY